MGKKVGLFLVIVLITVNTTYANLKAPTGMILGQGVNLRAAPNRTALKIGVLNYGYLLTVLESANQWYRVKLNNNQKGWIYKEYVTIRPSTIESGRRLLAKTRKLTDYAKIYLGNKYVYGGSSKAGFDCSGYTMFVYARFGYKLPHNALSQIRLGQEVNRTDLLSGDLVFFTTMRSSSINHVGIYLENGNFIHASSGAGRIKIDSLEERYYRLRYRGARRLLDKRVI
jgi:cell wall-associated NlpC family hydrolase